MTLRWLHRASAMALMVFIAAHLANHSAGFWGQDTHRAVQTVLRQFYRGWAEPVLLLACGVQAVTGLRLVWGRRRVWPRLGTWPRLQILSGGYLVVFLCIHVTAVLTGRAQGIDTDLAFAAAGLHAGGLWPWFFAPYYGLAVLSLGLHLGAALARKLPVIAQGTALAFAALALALVGLLAGYIVPLTIPAALIAGFGG